VTSRVYIKGPKSGRKIPEKVESRRNFLATEILDVNQPRRPDFRNTTSGRKMQTENYSRECPEE
jgi:hypothetical protein